MSAALPAEYEALRLRIRAFIREVVIPAEPRPGVSLRRADRGRASGATGWCGTKAAQWAAVAMYAHAGSRPGS